jgi:hypothetical protein
MMVEMERSAVSISSKVSHKPLPKEKELLESAMLPALEMYVVELEAAYTWDEEDRVYSVRFSKSKTSAKGILCNNDSHLQHGSS